MLKIKNVLFDLDGTIIESKEGIFNSILYALDKMGIVDNDTSSFSSFIGPPLIDSFQNRYDLDTEKANEAVTFYREYYTEKGIFQNTLYPGVEQLIKTLHKLGYRLFLATSKPTIYAKAIIQHFNLDSYFTDMVGSNLDNTRKDKTEIIEYVITNNNLHAHECIMIGDTKFDMIGGKNMKMVTIGVTYGHGALEDLKKYNADYIVNDTSEITSIINSIK